MYAYLFLIEGGMRMKDNCCMCVSLCEDEDEDEDGRAKLDTTVEKRAGLVSLSSKCSSPAGGGVLFWR